jgi:hypothetical protein
MSSFHQVLIGGFPGGGLTTDQKPLMLPDEAWSDLQNAYVFRKRTKKRDGDVSMGRLRRLFSNINWFLSLASGTPQNILTITGFVSTADNANPGKVTTTYPHNLVNGDKVIITGITGATGYNNVVFTITVVDALNFTVGVNAAGFGAYVSGGTFASNRLLKTNAPSNEPNATIQPGSVVYIIHNSPDIVFTDQGDGTLTSPTGGNSGTINYVSGVMTITTTATVGDATTLSYNYYPSLPVMGILKRDQNLIGIDATVFFDTKYAYQFVGGGTSGGFQELAPGTIWTAPNQSNGTNTNFFVAANYQGVTPDLKYFFVTNDYIDTSIPARDPIRYFDNSVWNDFTPKLTDNPPSATTTYLFQSLLLIPYYGRLLALNTWEGTSLGSATNFYSRCRFSQIGDPIDVNNSWRSDLFGRGGFIDAPTNEQIVGVAFHRNTLIVFFEYSTWQLRYIGEYGLPFIFERISSDFGSVSTSSPVVFDQGVLAISNRGVIQAGANGIKRIDEQIPETIFSFEIQNQAPNFVHGIRDFEKELVYWNYFDTGEPQDEQPQQTQVWPNAVLLYNYQNNTWAQYRDTITCFGTGQFQFGITWDSLTTSWDSNIPWDNVDDQNYVDYTVSGNQQGFVTIYGNEEAESPATQSPTMYAPSLAITGLTNGVPGTVTVPLHNLADGEIIYIQGVMTVNSALMKSINNKIFKVTVIDKDNITLSLWNQASNSYFAFAITGASFGYLGGGLITLLTKINIQGKDFNPFQSAGNQFKLSFIDFNMDTNGYTPSLPGVTIQLFVNSSLTTQANTISNQELLNTSQNMGFISNIQLNPAMTTPNPFLITSQLAHGLQTGQYIYLSGVVSPVSLATAANYQITVVDAYNFTLNGTNQTTPVIYTGNAIFNTLPVNGQSYQESSQYAWYRFYSTNYGQFLRVGITYDDTLMNQLSTHIVPMELNAMNFWFRPGGRIIN